MNQHNFLNARCEMECRAANLLRETLGRVPFLNVRRFDVTPLHGDAGYDLLAEIAVRSGETWTLVGEVKANPRPSIARMAILQLREYLQRCPEPRYGVLITPFVSEQTRAICIEHGVGYLDFAGNARLCFDHVFIEMTAPKAQQPSPKKVWKGLFGTRSGRALRRLLAEPRRSWKVAELADAAAISVGLVSNIRRALLEHEWAASGDEGLQLSRPEALLDAWKAAYQPAGEARQTFHTLLHGAPLAEAVRAALAEAGNGRHAILAGATAAQWLAPYAGGGHQRFYADAEGLAALQRHLRLRPAPRGANVIVDYPKDEGIFLDAVEPSPGIWCTSPVQTYLDLSTGNDRSVEAAEHLRTERLKPVFEA